MIFNCFSVLLLATAISCGHIVSRSFSPIVPIVHGVAQVQPQPQLVPLNGLPVSSFSTIQQLPGVPLVQRLVQPLVQPLIQPFVQPIARVSGIPLTVSSRFVQLPQTVPQNFLSHPRNVQLVVPQSIPSELLTITGQHRVVQPLVQTFQSIPIQSTIVSPAQKIRTQTTVLESAPVMAPIPSPEVPAPLQTESVPQIGSNTNFESTGFSTPTKPLNFAPILPEVNGMPQNQQNNQNVEQTPESVPQNIETPLPEVSQPIEGSLSQQPSLSLSQPITEEKIESLPQPMNSPQLTPLENTGVNKPLNSPSVGLNSYSF
jgi:hypothetical protein